MTRYLTAATMRELAAQLTERDEAVIRRVAGLRFVRGDQRTRLHFEGLSARATRRALMRLVELDCLTRLSRRIGGAANGSKAYVYLLAPAGQRLAMERGWTPRRRARRSQIPGTLFVAHALRVAELHTLLVEAEQAGHIDLLQLASEPACWRPYGPKALKPDSFVELANQDEIWSFFVEIDMGTEGSRAIERKLRQYAEYQATGREQAQHCVFPLTVWLTPDEGRAEAIRACIERLPSAAGEL